MPRKRADLDELDLTSKRSAAPPRGDFDPDDVEMTAERVKLDAGDSIEMTVQRPKLERDAVPHTRPTPVPFTDGIDDPAPPPAPPRRKLDVRLPDPPRRSGQTPAPSPHGSNVLPRAQVASGVHSAALAPHARGSGVLEDDDDEDLYYGNDLPPPPARPSPSRQTPAARRPEADPSFRPTRETPVQRRPVDAPESPPTGLVVPRRSGQTPAHEPGLAAPRRPGETPRPIIRTAHDSPTVVGAMPLPDDPESPPRRTSSRPPAPAYEDMLESPWSGDPDLDRRRSASQPAQPKAELRRSSQRFAAVTPRTPSDRHAATPQRSQPRIDAQPEPRRDSRGHKRVDEPRRKSQPRIDAREARARTPAFGSNVVKDEPGQQPTPYQFDPKAPVRGMPLDRPDPASGPYQSSPPAAGGPYQSSPHDDFAFEEPVSPEVAPTQHGAYDEPPADAVWELRREASPGDTFEMEVASFSDAEPTGIAAPPVEMEDRPITNLDPGERGLLAAIAAGSESSRAKYADWLARHGEAARAEFMRAEQDLHKCAPNDARRPVAVGRLAAVAARISMDWRSLVARSPIEGCPAAAQCPGVWNALPATDGDDHRVCSACAHPVFYCASLELAQKRRARGEYVAVDILVERRPGDLNTGTIQCLNCGTPVPSDARFCPNCGQSIQQVFQMGGY